MAIRRTGRWVTAVMCALCPLVTPITNAEVQEVQKVNGLVPNWEFSTTKLSFAF